jgi:N-acyl-D-amino-acid deacylase
MYDMIIKNGKLIDGTGNPGFHADLAIQNHRIAKIHRRIQQDAKQVIDATGLIVTPGFIDSHSHGDLVLESMPESQHKLEQGVTTEIAGMCGFSPAPLSIQHYEAGMRAMTNLMPQGVSGDMQYLQTFGQYMDHITRLSLGTSMACFVGHNTIRIAVMGYDDRTPDALELEQMKAYVEDAMKAGALGLSMGLFYAPGVYTQLNELIELCRVAARYGGLFSLHMRDEGEKLIQSVEEVLTIVRATGIKTVISHHKAAGRPEKCWGLPKLSLEMIDQVNAEGYDVFIDQYPYIASATVMNIYLPKEIHAAGFKEILRRLADQKERRVIRETMLGDESPDRFFAGVMISTSVSHPELNGMMLIDAAKKMQMDTCELYMDLLLHDELTTGNISWRISEEDVKRIMQHPRTMIGSDGLMYPGCTNCHPRAFGSFPRVLGYYVRELGVLTLEDAVRKMTSLPAMVYQLDQKGLLRVGMDADITIFDAEQIIDQADFKNCFTRCDGLHYVIVDGEVVVKNAIYQGGLYGKMMRFGQ